MRVPRMSLLSITNLILFLCGCLSNALNTGYKSYKGYAILTVQPGSQKDMEILRKLDSMFEEPMDYLKEPHGLRDNGQILVSPENLPLVKVFLNDHRIPFTTKPIHIGPARHRRALRPTDPYQLSEIVTSYLSYDDQMQYLDKTAAAFPYTTQIKNIGTSTEGRAIKIIKIGFPSPTNQQKPIIWIDAGIHAREWISYSVALFFIQQLTQNQKYSSVIKLIDFVIAPNVNPDGYEYSRTKDRFWRKTRSKHGDNRCYGSDGNRNYPFHFGEEGVTWNSCSEVYPGPYERSEPEVAALVREIMAYRQDIKAYVSLHSYGQEILYPWGHRTGAYPPDVNDLKAVANKMAEAIQRFDGTVYNVLNSGDGLYPASGASDDWAKSAGVKYSFTIELSPDNLIDGYDRFVLSESQINRVCNGVLPALDVLIKTVIHEFVHSPTIYMTKDPKPTTQYYIIRRSKRRRHYGRTGIFPGQRQ